jgi:hypothetical protein
MIMSGSQPIDYWTIDKKHVLAFGADGAVFIAALINRWVFLRETVTKRYVRPIPGQHQGEYPCYQEIDYGGGFFCYLKSEIEQDTGLSFAKQAAFVKKLVSYNILQVVKTGMPSRIFYRITQVGLDHYVRQVLRQRQRTAGELPQDEDGGAE